MGDTSAAAHARAEVMSLSLAAATCSPGTAAPSDNSTIEDWCGAQRGKIEFEDSIDAIKRHEFAADFRGDLARLEDWAASWQWTAPPIPKLRVLVSSRFKISRSLVPAWSDQRGYMEFPAWRVVAGKAAITHELVHVYFPNGNRLLAEGLAVYLQAQIGGNPAFPNFSRSLHDLVGKLLQDIVPELSQGGLASLAPYLADLDAIETPSPLTLRMANDYFGEEPRGQAHLYSIAGSFVQFLIELRGLEAFRTLYEQTPLITLQQYCGSPTRWVAVYGLSLGELARDWELFIARHKRLKED